MRTRSSLGNDPSSAPAAGPSSSSTSAARQRPARLSAGKDNKATDDRATRNGETLDEGDMIVIGLEEAGPSPDQSTTIKLDEKAAAAAAGDAEGVTRVMKGKGRLEETSSSYVAPRSPHPKRFQADLPPSSQASKASSPTESHAQLSQAGPREVTSSRCKDGAAAAARSDDERPSSSPDRAAGVGFSEWRSPPYGAADSLDGSHALASFAPNGEHDVPHPTDVLRRPPAFELPDSSPLDRDMLAQDEEQSMSADDSNQTIHPSDILDEDEDALMLPAQESTYPYAFGQASIASDEAFDTENFDAPQMDPVSEESFDHQTGTRRNLLPSLLRAEDVDESPSISGNERSSPRRAARLVPTAPGSAFDEEPPIEIFGLSQRSAIPVALGAAKSAFRSIQLEAEPNPFRDPAGPARTSRLGQHRKSHSLAGHERAANVSRSTAGGDSSFLEADSFAARRNSATRPAKARDSLGMRSRVPRKAASSSSAASSSGPVRPTPVIAFGQAQILLGSADPCVCGFTIGGKRPTLAALNEEEEMADDSLLGGKENSSASSIGRGATGWEAHAKRCVGLKDLRDQGWRIFRET